MKQIRFNTFGRPTSVARCCTVDDPGPPSAWEVLVDIEACAVTPADLARLTGRYGELPKLPATLGLEAVGRIVACGASVRGIALGDRVILVVNDNWCQRRRVGESMVYKVAPELDVLQLASLKVNACTALELVRRHLPLEPGAWVVQNAPLSGVGRAVMQIARYDGLRTLNIVRRPEAIAQVLAAGGDAAIEDGPEMVSAARAAMSGAAASIAFDAVGGDGVMRLGELLESGATIVNYGILSGQPARIACETLIFHDVTLKGFWLMPRLGQMTHAQRNALFDEAVALLSAGVLQAEVAATYPLEAIEKALRHAEDPGRQGGRVYLLPNGPLATSVAESTLAS